jgi:hypothetical protein
LVKIPKKEGRAVDNVYLGETNVSVGYLVYFVIFFTTRELAINHFCIVLKRSNGCFNTGVLACPALFLFLKEIVVSFSVYLACERYYFRPNNKKSLKIPKG